MIPRYELFRFPDDTHLLVPAASSLALEIQAQGAWCVMAFNAESWEEACEVRDNFTALRKLFT